MIIDVNNFSLMFAVPFRRHTNKRREIDLSLRAKIKCHVFLEQIQTEIQIL